MNDTFYAGTKSLLNQNHDGFLVGLSPSGSVSWIEKFGGSEYDYVFALATNSSDIVGATTYEACQECPSGKYASSASVMCTKCSSQAPLTARGATSVANCATACPSGTYLNGPGLCDMCESGEVLHRENEVDMLYWHVLLFYDVLRGTLYSYICRWSSSSCILLSPKTQSTLR